MTYVAAVLFWFVMLLVILCLLLAVPILMLGSLVWWIIRLLFCLPLPSWSKVKISTENAARLEDEASKQEIINEVTIHNVMLPAPPSGSPGFGGMDWQANMIELNEDPSLPTMLLLHGTGSFALSMLKAMQTLGGHYRIIAIDLPGGGRSTGVPPLNSSSAETLIEVFCDFLDRVVDHFKLTQYTICAHSIAAFMAIHWAARNGDNVAGLVLIDPAGILPTLSDKGAHWAVLFKLGIPASFLRSLGILGSLAISPLILRSPVFRWVWLQVNASATGFNIPTSFISLGFHKAFWTHPALARLMSLNVPLGFVWGKDDPIMPVHQGHTVVSLLRAQGVAAPLEVIEGGHTPWHKDGGTALCKGVLTVTEKFTGSSSNAGLDAPLIRTWDIQADRFGSYFDPKATSRVIEELYAELQAQ